MKNSTKPSTLGILGFGNLGESLLQGLIHHAQVAEQSLWISAPRKASVKRAEAHGVNATTSNEELLARAELVFLAVKPQKLETVLKPLKEHWRAKHILISTLAGTSLSHILYHLPQNTLQGVFRIMPNVPIKVGQGVIAMCHDKRSPQRVQKEVQSLLSHLGQVIALEENQMDAATGLSGSGPAYVFLLIEAISDGGVKMGLSRRDALLMATQTVLGAAQYLLQSGQHPAQLKDSVTSPAGTAINALHILERGGIRDTLMNAVEAATQRAAQLNVVKT